MPVCITYTRAWVAYNIDCSFVGELQYNVLYWLVQGHKDPELSPHCIKTKEHSSYLPILSWRRCSLTECCDHLKYRNSHLPLNHIIWHDSLTTLLFLIAPSLSITYYPPLKYIITSCLINLQPYSTLHRNKPNR